LVFNNDIFENLCKFTNSMYICLVSLVGWGIVVVGYGQQLILDPLKSSGMGSAGCSFVGDRGCSLKEDCMVFGNVTTTCVIHHHLKLI